LTSDRGSQFTSGLWSELCRFLNICHSPTTAYHLEANGMVERLHRRLKDALRARAATAANWANHVPWVLLSLRTAPREDDGISPAERTYGSPLVVPGQFLIHNEINFEKVQQNVNNILSKNPSLPRHNIPAGQQQPPSLPPELERAPLVLVRGEWRPPAAGCPLWRPLRRRRPQSSLLHRPGGRASGDHLYQPP
jgi:transposase InsO family protein